MDGNMTLNKLLELIAEQLSNNGGDAVGFDAVVDDRKTGGQLKIKVSAELAEE